MKSKIKFNTLVFVEIGLIFLLWLVSILVSKPVFNRPLGNHHEWLTAHTLVSMRAFEDWGFWKLLGASVLIPKSYEFLDSDITIFTKEEGIYLSYPSLWLVLPYVTFKLLNFLHLNISLSVQYLQIYNLVVNRFICGIIIYSLYIEILKIIIGDTLKGYKRRIIAFLGLVGWMFAPPVMYWTQNVYGPDQPVLLPIYIIFLISLKCKFKFKELSNLHKALVFVVSFLACSMDWYGWVSIAVILLLVLVDEWLLIDKKLFSFLGFCQQYFDSIKFIFLGMLLAGLTFVVQILYYKDGIRQVVDIFFYRTGVLKLANEKGLPLTLKQVFVGILHHWIPYFPEILQQTLRNRLLVTINLLLVLGCFYYIYKNSKYKKLFVYAWSLVFLVPLTQLYFLKQHSYTHDFSALKMGFPIVLSLLVLPVTTLVKVVEISPKKFVSIRGNGYVSFFILSLGLVLVISSRNGIIEFADEAKKSNQELGFIVSSNFAYEDLLIADPTSNRRDNLVLGPSTPKGLLPPEPMWYTNRWIHSSNQLKNLKLRVKTQRLKSMNPVFLAYKDVSSKSSVSSICESQWQDLAGTVAGRELVACRAPELRRLLE